MLSFWEKESFVQYDYIIVGAGITGLSAALALKKKSPASSVLVCERGLLPTGASTKNAGFACFGSVTELLDDLQHLSENDLLGLVDRRYRGLQKLRETVGDDTMEYEPLGGYELLNDTNDQAVEQVDYLNDLLKPIFNEPVFSIVKNANKFGFDPDSVRDIIFNQFEGQIHTGKMMKSLWQLASEKGVHILTGAEVQSIEKGILDIRQAAGTLFQLKYGQVAICTNAFTDKILPSLDFNPGRGLVLVTGPIENLPFHGSFHMEAGYYYFRNIGNRVIFGGGRHLDFDGERTTEFKINEKIAAVLKEKLRKVILPNHSYEIKDWWTGVMAFGESKIPIVERMDSQTVVGIRLGGMGVAIGSLVGEEVAGLLLN